ncbi:hypothetical protein Tco_0155063 [Tanacetum coccineum]
MNSDNEDDIMDPDSYKDGDGDASFQLKSDSLPHAHAQTTKTYYSIKDFKNHESSRIKDQRLSAQYSDIKR